MRRTRIGLAASLLTITCCTCGEEAGTCLIEPLGRTVPIEPGTTCQAGGTRVDVGGDYNCNALFDDAEVTSTVVVCSEPAGVASLVVVETVTPGEACSEGGSVVRAGLDDNRDGVLDPEEIDTESYACNGLPADMSDRTCDGAASIYMGTLVVEDERALMALQGVTCVDGSVIVSSETLTSLELASSLEKVTGDLLLIGNGALESLAGLRALQSVGTTFMIQNNDVLLDLRGMDALERFGSLRIVGNKLLTSLVGLERFERIGGGELVVSAVPALTSLAGLENLREVRTLDLRNLDALTDVSALANLTRATGQIRYVGNDALTHLVLHLQRVDAPLDIFENEGLASVELPELVLAGDLRVRDNPGLQRVSAPGLRTGIGIELTNNPVLRELDASSVVYLSGALQMGNNPALVDLGLGALTTLGGGLNIRGTTMLTDLRSFASLETISGPLGLRDNAAMTRFAGLENVTMIAGSVTFRDNQALTTLVDLANLSEISGALEITGNRQLPTSEAEAFSQRVQVGDSVTISGNGPN